MSKLFGENLKKARLERGLTTTACAKLLEISQPAWNFYELGSREPKLDALVRICEILNTTPNKLLGSAFSSDEPFNIPKPHDSIMRSIRELHKAANRLSRASNQYIPAVTELCEKAKQFMDIEKEVL